MIQRINLSNGMELEYLDKGEGDVILLLHGLGSTKADWDFQIDTFSKHYRVIAPDLRGHGNSSKPKTRNEYGISLCAEDNILLVKELKIDQFTVVGFSMGGAVAFEMAVKYPELISKLIVVNTSPDFNNLGEMGEKMIKDRTRILDNSGMEPLAKQVAESLFPEEGQSKLRNAFYERVKSNSVRSYFNSFITLMEWGIAEKIKDIKAPALVIASDQDYTPVSLKEAYSQKMENSKVKVIDYSRHGITMDQPNQFNSVVLNFLNNG